MSRFGSLDFSGGVEISPLVSAEVSAEVCIGRFGVQEISGLKQVEMIPSLIPEDRQKTWPAHVLPFPSDEQKEIASQILLGHNVIVKAVAGAGKTTSMLQTALLLFESSKANGKPPPNVLILSYNKALQSASEGRVSDLERENLLPSGRVQCFTLHGLGQRFYKVPCNDDLGLLRIARDGLGFEGESPEFSHIFVDEAQDLSSLLFSFFLKFVVDSLGVEEPPLRPPPVLAIFGDAMQAVYGYKGCHADYLLRAEELLIPVTHPGTPWVSLPLTTSNRITGNMARFLNECVLPRHTLVSRKFLATQSGGPPVHYWSGDNFKVAIELAEDIIARVQKGDLLPAEVMVIGPSLASYSKNHSPLQVLLNRLSGNMLIFKKEEGGGASSMDQPGVVATTRHSSKGLERRVVIIFGFSSKTAYYVNRANPDSPPVDDTVCSEAWYVGLTRAQEELHIVGNTGGVDLSGHLDEPIAFLKMPEFMKLTEQGVVKKHGLAAWKRRAEAENDGDFEDEGAAPILVRKLLDHVSDAVLEAAMESLKEFWACAAKPGARIHVPSHTTVDSIFDHGKIVKYRTTLPVAHLNGIAIPTMLFVGSKTKGGSASSSSSSSSSSGGGGGGGVEGRGGETPKVHTYEELASFFKEPSDAQTFLQTTEQRAHFSRLAKPSLTNGPEWYIQVAALWHAVASIERGFLFQYTQLLPSEWKWLKGEEAEKCKGRLQSLVVDFSHPDSQAELVVEATAKPSGGCKDDLRTIKGQMDIVTPSTVWELKCHSAAGNITRNDKLQLAMYAWLWHMTRPDEVRQFKVCNILSGEVFELALSAEKGGVRTWLERGLAGLYKCAQVLIDNKLGQARNMRVDVVELHEGDYSTFRSAALLRRRLGGGLAASGSGSSSGEGGAGVKRPR